MKTGKYISLGEYKNIKIGYGTVDYKNLKTIYLKLNSWLEPKYDNDEIDLILNQSRKKIKNLLYNQNNKNFKKESIVDLDVKTKGIKLEKKSFMNLEITLFVDSKFDIKHANIKNHVNNILENIIDECLINENVYKFFKTKK